MRDETYNWKLRKAIQSAGYTYKTLAKKTGIHYMKIHRMVTGVRVPKQSERVLLSSILRTPQKELWR